MAVDRREIIKLSSIIPFSLTSPRLRDINFETDKAPNILVIVFDAFSAMNCSLFGYPRKTTPLIEELSNKAIVYHNHFAGGPFTTPGTATLLTGLLPWTTRAVTTFDQISKEYESHNIFNLLGEDYYCSAYTHNSLSDVFLRQFIPYLEKYIPRQDLFLRDYWVSKLFIKDFDIAFISALNAIEDTRTIIKSSVFFSELNARVFERMQQEAAKPYFPKFPRDVPNISGKYFLLEDGIDWLLEHLGQIDNPFMGYFHFMPPHAPYTTRKEFINRHFNDGYEPVPKERHLFGLEKFEGRADRVRRTYDEYINYVDEEFDRLFTGLKAEGVLDNTWVVLTSDHGEMFERGIIGHSERSMHQPLVKIPLVIFPPDSQERVDVTVNTSAIDVVPTLLHIAGKPIPEICEGEVLPPFSDEQGFKDRPVYCVRAYTKNTSYFTSYTLMMVKDHKKLVYYDGYKELPDKKPLIEFFDIEEDPEELNNLNLSERGLADQYVQQLLEKLEEVEKPYK